MSALAGPSSARPYRYMYGTEISQMLFVLGEPQASSEDVVRFIEDIVRSQILESVGQARQHATRRGSRFLGVEDLIFLIRHDRSRVYRLRTYLGWREVRRKTREAEHADAGGELEYIMDESFSDKDLKAERQPVRLPWDLNTMFSDSIPDDGDDDTGVNDENEEEIETYREGEQRLKELDDLTATMSQEHYLQYAECRQASFTYKKSKKFRDFVNLNSIIEGPLTDEVVDALGFLAYEIVRTLCEAGLRVQAAREALAQLKEREAQEAAARRQERLAAATANSARKRPHADSTGEHKHGEGASTTSPRKSKRKRASGAGSAGDDKEPRTGDGDGGDVEMGERKESPELSDEREPSAPPPPTSLFTWPENFSLDQSTSGTGVVAAFPTRRASGGTIVAGGNGTATGSEALSRQGSSSGSGAGEKDKDADDKDAPAESKDKQEDDGGEGKREEGHPPERAKKRLTVEDLYDGFFSLQQAANKDKTWGMRNWQSGQRPLSLALI